MNQVKIFHHNDLDGYAAAAAVFYERYEGVYDPIIQFIELSHESTDKEKIETVEEGDIVWLVDYSFSESTLPNLKYILKKANKVYWIDHHNTSIKLVKMYPELVQIDGLVLEGISGAALTYMYINGIKPENYEDEVPYFLKIISDYDCWQKKYSQSDFFALGMKVTDMRNISSTTYSSLFKDKSMSKSTTVDTIVERGLTIRKYLNEEYKFIREHYGYEAIIEDYKCFCVNNEGNSWVFGDLISQYPICILFSFNGESYMVSLYSDDPDVDCSKIAEKFGGGGHRGAAGFTCTALPFKKIN